MDILDDILDTLNLKGAFYFRTDFSPPWGVTVPDFEQAARFHLVVQGHCQVCFQSGAKIDLTPGDIVLIPRGRSHILSDGSCVMRPPLEQVIEKTGYDGQGVFVVEGGDKGASTQMICGHFTFRSGADHPILRALPEYLLTTSVMRLRQPWLDEMLRLVGRSVFSDEIGSQAAVKRLSEIVFIELLRVGIEQSDDLRSVLEAFRDKQIGRSLELIHASSAQPWTVETLALEVGMSRSRFAERFSGLMQVGPMAYLSEWRLQKALSMLDSSRSTIQQVAKEVGYQSPAAFTRAFAGKFGVPPTEYRRISA